MKRYSFRCDYCKRMRKAYYGIDVDNQFIIFACRWHYLVTRTLNIIVFPELQLNVWRIDRKNKE